MLHVERCMLCLCVLHLLLGLCHILLVLRHLLSKLALMVVVGLLRGLQVSRTGMTSQQQALTGNWLPNASTGMSTWDGCLQSIVCLHSSPSASNCI